MTAKYLKENGHHTAHNDPNRLVWYSNCSYWTDDWTKLSSVGPGAAIGQGIPCCPNCKCPGFQTTFSSWEESSKNYEHSNHPHYQEFLNKSKETCLGRGGSRMFMKNYNEWLLAKERNES